MSHLRRIWKNEVIFEKGKKIVSVVSDVIFKMDFKSALTVSLLYLFVEVSRFPLRLQLLTGF